MVVKIRLARFGKRNAPFYNIVVAHARYPHLPPQPIIRITLPTPSTFPTPAYFSVISLTLSSTERSSKPLEVLGTYDPIPKPAPLEFGKPIKDIKLDTARAKYWLGVGAQPSEPAWRLLSMIGLLEPKYHVQKMQQAEMEQRKKVRNAEAQAER